MNQREKNRQTELLNDPLFKHLVDEQIQLFNQKKAEQKGALNFSGGMLRGLDLRQLNADNIDFENAYFRGADLRGIDFSKANLTGASIAGANISGTLFPDSLSPEEIRLSVELGTRMRATRSTS